MTLRKTSPEKIPGYKKRPAFKDPGSIGTLWKYQETPVELEFGDFINAL
jgi:hypothetical protein